jgi:hypothetical protein
MSAKTTDRRGLSEWVHERRKGLSVIALLVIGYGIVLIGIQVKHYYNRLDFNNHQAAQDWYSKVFVGVLIGLGILVLIGLSLISMWLGRYVRRQDAEFEASIAHLTPDEQVWARRRREMQRAAMAWGAYLITHEAMKARSRRQHENMMRTRERWDRANAWIEEGNERDRQEEQRRRMNDDGYM